MKRAVMPIIDSLFWFILICGRLRMKKKENYISLCAIFRDESVYLEEWLEYHRIIGIDKVYMYNNLSEDNYLATLAPYVASGYVELIDWPYEGGQMSAYEDCYQKARHKTNWLCFLDIDEFICPHQNKSIKDWLAKHEGMPSVLVYWKMFGTSGKHFREKKLLTEELTVSWPSLYDVGKIFINTDYEPSKIYHHKINSIVNICGMKARVPSLNQFGKFVYFNINRTSTFGKFDIQINHYWSKTFAEYIDRKSKRKRAYNNESVYDMDYFLKHEMKNTSVDYTIYKYIIELKRNMGIK